MVDFGTRFSFFEWVGRCFDGTLGHIRATLSTLLSGEDETNEWISTNSKGFKKVRGVRFNYSATGPGEKTVDTAINVEKWSFKNTTNSVIWVGFGVASITVPANDATTTTDLFPIDALTSCDIEMYAAAGANQLRIENVSTATGDFYVMALGNS